MAPMVNSGHGSAYQTEACTYWPNTCTEESVSPVEYNGFTGSSEPHPPPDSTGPLIHIVQRQAGWRVDGYEQQTVVEARDLFVASQYR